MSDARDLLDRDRRVCWHPFTQHATSPDPMPVTRAEGAWLELADGRRVLDAISSWWTTLHGHGHPRIAEAIARQARELDHVLYAGCTHPPGVELAERLVARAPEGLTRVFYSDDGSTAVEVALKMAFQYWTNHGHPERTGFVAFDHAYHGDTVGAMAPGEPDQFTEHFRPLLFPVERLHPAHTARCPDAADGIDVTDVAARLAELEALLQRKHHELAAVVVEPMIQGAGGMQMQPAAWLRGVRDLCRRYGVFLVADEVMTGFGRTGPFFACEHAGVTPDLLALSKGITGGALPLAATLATDELWEAFWRDETRLGFLHGHSYTANPIACAAGVASLEIFDEEPVQERIDGLERFYADRLARFRDHPRVKDVRWMGSVGVVEVAGEQGGYFDALGPWLRRGFMERDLLVRPLGTVVYTLPPYGIDHDDLNRVWDALEEMLEQL